MAPMAREKVCTQPESRAKKRRSEHIFATTQDIGQPCGTNSTEVKDGLKRERQQRHANDGKSGRKQWRTNYEINADDRNERSRRDDKETHEQQKGRYLGLYGIYILYISKVFNPQRMAGLPIDSGQLFSSHMPAVEIVEETFEKKGEVGSNETNDVSISVASGQSVYKQKASILFHGRDPGISEQTLIRPTKLEQNKK